MLYLNYLSRSSDSYHYRSLCILLDKFCYNCPYNHLYSFLGIHLYIFLHM